MERLLPDGKALVETSRRAHDNRYPLCIADSPTAANVLVELAFVPHGGTLERAAGIVLRFADAQDYYVVQASSLQRAIRFTRVVNGTQTQLATRDAAIATGRAILAGEGGGRKKLARSVPAGQRRRSRIRATTTPAAKPAASHSSRDSVRLSRRCSSTSSSSARASLLLSR